MFSTLLSLLMHFLKDLGNESQTGSYWRQHKSLAYCPPTCWSFRVGLNKNADSFFATRCCFWSGKNSGFSGNAVHKAALRSQTLLYQALHDDMKMKPIEPIVERIISSRWACKVKKINAYYKTMKLSTCCWGLPKPKHEPFITHNRGTSMHLCWIKVF